MSFSGVKVSDSEEKTLPEKWKKGERFMCSLELDSIIRLSLDGFTQTAAKPSTFGFSDSGALVDVKRANGKPITLSV